MKLRALKAYDYYTRRLKAGDEFDSLADNEARDLITLGLARDVTTDTEKAPPLRRRPRLQTRDFEVKAGSEVEASKTVVTKKQSRAAKVAARSAKAEPLEEEPQGVKSEESVDSLVDKTVPELREIAEDQGVDLPGGYIKRDDLIDMLKSEEDE